MNVSLLNELEPAVGIGLLNRLQHITWSKLYNYYMEQGKEAEGLKNQTLIGGPHGGEVSS